MLNHFVSRSLLMAEDGEAGAGAGAEKTGGIDTAALKGEILGEIRKDLNGLTKNLKNDFASGFKDLLQKLKPEPNGEGQGEKHEEHQGEKQGEKAQDGKPVDPEKNALTLEFAKYRRENEARVQALEKKNAETEAKAEQTWMDSQLTSELSKFTYASDKARETASQIYRGVATRGDDGKLVANDLPLGKFLENDLPANHPYLLAAKDVSGAGARGGRGAASKKYDLDKQSSGYVLKPENFKRFNSTEQAEIRQAIASS